MRSGGKTSYCLVNRGAGWCLIIGRKLTGNLEGYSEVNHVIDDILVMGWGIYLSDISVGTSLISVIMMQGFISAGDNIVNSLSSVTYWFIYYFKLQSYFKILWACSFGLNFRSLAQNNHSFWSNMYMIDVNKPCCCWFHDLNFIFDILLDIMHIIIAQYHHCHHHHLHHHHHSEI